MFKDGKLGCFFVFGFLNIIGCGGDIYFVSFIMGCGNCNVGDLFVDICGIEKLLR